MMLCLIIRQTAQNSLIGKPIFSGEKTMKIQKLVWLAVSSFAVAGLLPASAQQELQKRFEELKRPDLGQLVIPDDAFRSPGFDSGATHWISPMLDNSPGTINGEPFTIDRKRLMQTFELSTVNPNGSQPANAYVNCFIATGAHLTRYATSFIVPPMGASNWSASTVTPPASGDGGVTDVDSIWCSVGADVPIVVYGWTVRRFGSEVSKSHFSLEPAAPASRWKTPGRWLARRL